MIGAIKTVNIGAIGPEQESVEIGEISGPGLYILEGHNGAGKSTLLGILERLQARRLSGLSDGLGAVTLGQTTGRLEIGAARLVLDRLPVNVEYPHGEVIVGERLGQQDLPEIVQVSRELRALVDGDQIKDEEARAIRRLVALLRLAGVECKPAHRDHLCKRAVELSGAVELPSDITELWRATSIPEKTKASRSPELRWGWKVSASDDLVKVAEAIRAALMGDARALEYLHQQAEKASERALGAQKAFENENAGLLTITEDEVTLKEYEAAQGSFREAERAKAAYDAETERLGRMQAILEEDLGPEPDTASARKKTDRAIRAHENVADRLRSTRQALLQVVDDLQREAESLSPTSSTRLHPWGSRCSAAGEALVAAAKDISGVDLQSAGDEYARACAANGEWWKKKSHRDIALEEIGRDRPAPPDVEGLRLEAERLERLYKAGVAQGHRDNLKAAYLQARGLVERLDFLAKGYRSAAVKIWAELGVVVTNELALDWVVVDGLKIGVKLAGEIKWVDDAGSISTGQLAKAAFEMALAWRDRRAPQMWLIPVDPARGENDLLGLIDGNNLPALAAKFEEADIVAIAEVVSDGPIRLRKVARCRRGDGFDEAFDAKAQAARHGYAVGAAP
jgi:energy-coupling factor transporter ATP-binding protein EcfA2